MTTLALPSRASMGSVSGGSRRRLASTALSACLVALTTAQAPPPQFAELRGGHFPLGAHNATDLAAADVDGDGDADVLVASESVCILHRNDGRAVFGAGITLPGGSAQTAAFADVDGDGDPDLILGRQRGIAGVRNSMLRNDGAGGFVDVTLTHMPLSADVTRAIALGDVDRDGDLDLVFGNESTNRLCLNNGAGLFTEAGALRLPPGGASTTSVVLGDVDGDGDLDLVVGNQRSNNQLYLNDGAGTFTVATTGRLPTLIGWTQAVLLVDVDGDRDLDLLIGEDGQAVRSYRNDGTGRFVDVTATTMPNTPIGTTDLAGADVDGDGDADLIVASHFGGNRLYVNDGTGRFAEAPVSRLAVDGLWSTSVVASDLDGDARPDLVFGGASCATGQTQVHLNDGQGGFTPASAATLPGDCGETYSLAPLTDIDGDGDLDLIVGNEGHNLLLRNVGEGVFAPLYDALPQDSDTTYGLATGDVDGDGDADLLAGNASTQARLYRNDGRGHFTDATARLPVRADNVSDVLLIDVDGDRDLDAVLAVRGDQTRLYTNDGTGTFTDITATHMPVLLAATAALAAVDVDRDGDLDLILANHAEVCRLLVNDGTGRFTDRTATHMPGTIAPTEGIAVADVDGDGDVDLVIANYGPAQLFQNDGTGRFVDATAGRLPGTNTVAYGAVAADLDDDGDVDLVIDERMFLNDGTGRFTDVTAQRLPMVGRPSALVAGDVDGDGDQDLVFGSIPTVLLTNHLRQLHTPYVARRDASFALDFTVEPRFAPATRTVIAWLSLGRLTPAVTFPPFGAWGLDPAIMVQLPALAVLPSSGTVRVAFPLPAGAPIAGLTLYSQALVSHGALARDWRLTGVAADTVIH